MTKPLTDKEEESLRSWAGGQLPENWSAAFATIDALRAELKTLLTDLVKADDNALQARREADALRAEVERLRAGIIEALTDAQIEDGYAAEVLSGLLIDGGDNG